MTRPTLRTWAGGETTVHNDDSTPTRPLKAAELVIMELATSEAALLAEVRELAADMAVYRELSHVSVAEMAKLTRLVESQSRTIIALRDELRRYTASAVLGRAA